MTILNVEKNKKKKEKIKEIVKENNQKTISEFVRSSIDEKLKIEELTGKKFEISKIPEWIPDGKYIAFVNGAIVSIGDTVSEVSRESAEKFRDLPCIIKRKGKPIEVPEYIFNTFAELKCWNYSILENKSFPLILLEIGVNNNYKTIRALPDSAASLSVLKSSLARQLNLKSLRTERVFTTAGPIELKVSKADIKINDLILTSEILEGEISDEMPFDLLLGRNIIDLFDIYLLGKKQIICLKDP